MNLKAAVEISDGEPVRTKPTTAVPKTSVRIISPSTLKDDTGLKERKAKGFLTSAANTLEVDADLKQRKQKGSLTGIQLGGRSPVCPPRQVPRGTRAHERPAVQLAGSVVW